MFKMASGFGGVVYIGVKKAWNNWALPTNDYKLDTPPSPKKAKVFVWSGDRDNVGHVSMQLPSGAYTSIWPDKTIAVGPFAYLPLHATLATALEQDIKAESKGFTVELGAGEESLIPSHVKKLPDQEFSVTISEPEKLEEEFKRIKEGVKQGTIRYQLFATSHPFPTSHLLHTDEEEYNCATLVDHLLKEGGVPLPTNPHWRPSEFSEDLEKQSEVKKLSK
jgi:hypothetical protein